MQTPEPFDLSKALQRADEYVARIAAKDSSQDVTWGRDDFLAGWFAAKKEGMNMETQRELELQAEIDALREMVKSLQAMVRQGCHCPTLPPPPTRAMVEEEWLDPCGIFPSEFKKPEGTA